MANNYVEKFFEKLIYCSYLIISSNKVVQCLGWLSKIYLQEKKKLLQWLCFSF